MPTREKANKTKTPVRQTIRAGILFEIITGAGADKRLLKNKLEEVNSRIKWSAAINIDGDIFFPVITGTKSIEKLHESHAVCDQKVTEANNENIIWDLDKIAKDISKLNKSNIPLKRLNVITVQVYTLDSRLQAVGEKHVIK
jgi:hypothetical protein